MEEKVKALIIDDNEDFLFTMSTFLERNGFQTITATDGKKGVELAKKERPDVILLDVMMETLFSGFEVCRELRNNPELKDVLIISISGMGEELGVKFDKETDEEYFSPDVFFEKPVDKNKLLETSNELLKKRKK